ncbi:hypothetical protein F4806DRAFT_320285 [Annulohypoxylon nitens]|nr:hypothetical protein F4806DRAFT_320285 [Annulohypoxylon nitens]
MSRSNFAISTASIFPIYPRVHSMTSRPKSYLKLTCIAGVSSATPFNQTRYPYSPSVFGWNYSKSYQNHIVSRNLSTLRTMADPVLRTASPYTDPSVKGPKSQQLTNGHSHSLLQHSKMIANNKVNKTALHPSGVEPHHEREHTELGTKEKLELIPPAFGIGGFVCRSANTRLS